MKHLMNPEDLISYFATINDPRIERTKYHKLIDILVISLCAFICGADTWIQIEQYGKSKKEWLKAFLELPHGIPSHDTFNRVFAALNPKEFEECFMKWVRGMMGGNAREIIAIDGKTARRSHRGGKGALHMVSAWARENGIVVGQVKTEEKSNEITAIPELLKVIDVRGAIITIDAMGTQKKIARDIVKRGGDYVLSLKGNQELFHQEVKDYFEDARIRKFKDIEYVKHKTVEKDHGRIETRKYWLTTDIDWFSEKNKWSGLRSIGMVEAQRDINGSISTEVRFYISSLQNDAEEFARAVRGHWSVENSLHWVLDIAFREDECRTRMGNAPENLAIMRRFALNILKADTTLKCGIKAKRLRAGWDQSFLESLLSKI
jgi:predicted transposase YbfD/YdcC